MCTYSEYDEDGESRRKTTPTGRRWRRRSGRSSPKSHGAQKTAHEKYLAKCAAEGVDAMKGVTRKVASGER